MDPPSAILMPKKETLIIGRGLSNTIGGGQERLLSRTILRTIGQKRLNLSRVCNTRVIR